MDADSVFLIQIYTCAINLFLPPLSPFLTLLWPNLAPNSPFLRHLFIFGMLNQSLIFAHLPIRFHSFF